MPVGTRATLDLVPRPNQDPPTLETPIIICAACEGDNPVQDANVLIGRDDIEMWFCQRCNNVWGIVLEENTRDRAVPLTSRELATWYSSRVRLLVEAMERGGRHPTHVEVSATVWTLLYDAHNEATFMLYGIPARRVLDFLSPDTRRAMVTLQTRDAIRSAALPVSRLGSVPNRSPEITGNNPLLTWVQEQRTIRALPQPTPMPPPEKTVRLEEQMGIPTMGSTWVNRGTGVLIEVTGLSFAEGTQQIIQFRAVLVAESNIREPHSRLGYDDFVTLHRVWHNDGKTEMPYLDLGLQLGDEWIQNHNRVVVEILHIDHKKETVSVYEKDTKRRSALKMREFAPGGNWRKIVRRTAFEALEDDDFG
jgi:hypothetical protein